MYFPWLPQYTRSREVDAIVHLTNETWTVDSHMISKFEDWTCQYRAIETRRWQLVCAMQGNSAVIDPSGAHSVLVQPVRAVPFDF